jgi:hypothetical protein
LDLSFHPLLSGWRNCECVPRFTWERATSERLLTKRTSTCSGNTRSTGTSNLASYGLVNKGSAKRLERGKSPIRERTNAVITRFAICAYRNRIGVFATTKVSRSDDKDDVFETQLARSSRVVDNGEIGKKLCSKYQSAVIQPLCAKCLERVS